jgi:hypothetical protein
VRHRVVPTEQNGRRITEEAAAMHVISFRSTQLYQLTTGIPDTKSRDEESLRPIHNYMDLKSFQGLRTRF